MERNNPDFIYDFFQIYECLTHPLSDYSQKQVAISNTNQLDLLKKDTLNGCRVSFFLFMITSDLKTHLQCATRHCEQPALIIYHHQWFCVLHALAKAKIRQLILEDEEEDQEETSTQQVQPIQTISPSTKEVPVVTASPDVVNVPFSKGESTNSCLADSNPKVLLFYFSFSIE